MTNANNPPTPATPPASAPANLPDSKGDAGAAQVQARVDAEQEQGFVGTVSDPTPNENYTVAGVVAKKPTPETDADLNVEARKAAGLK